MYALADAQSQMRQAMYALSKELGKPNEESVKRASSPTG